MITGTLKSEVVDNNAALYLAACTVENRIDSGWSYSNVLDHYYVPFTEPTEEEVNIVSSVIKEENRCPDVYFVYSQEDVDYLFKEYTFMYKICKDGKCNIFMSKQQYREVVWN